MATVSNPKKLFETLSEIFRVRVKVFLWKKITLSILTTLVSVVLSFLKVEIFIHVEFALFLNFRANDKLRRSSNSFWYRIVEVYFFTSVVPKYKSEIGITLQNSLKQRWLVQVSFAIVVKRQYLLMVIKYRVENLKILVKGLLSVCLLFSFFVS